MNRLPEAIHAAAVEPRLLQDDQITDNARHQDDFIDDHYEIPCDVRGGLS